MSVFSELKRRNVFRVGLLYVIASWIILKVTDVGVSLLHIPTWVGKLILVLLTVGLPLILIFSLICQQWDCRNSGPNAVGHYRNDVKWPQI